jgi:hypothetical protein
MEESVCTSCSDVNEGRRIITAEMRHLPFPFGHAAFAVHETKAKVHQHRADDHFDTRSPWLRGQGNRAKVNLTAITVYHQWNHCVMRGHRHVVDTCRRWPISGRSRFPLRGSGTGLEVLFNTARGLPKGIAKADVPHNASGNVVTSKHRLSHFGINGEEVTSL